MKTYPFNTINTTTILSTTLRPSSFHFTYIEKTPCGYGSKKRANASMLLVKFFLVIILGSLLFSSCRKDEFLPDTPKVNPGNVLLKETGLTYYVDLAGNDVTGNGSAGLPWKSLYKACSTVTSTGSIIHIASGTYIETQLCNLALGVSVQGADPATTIIKSRYGKSGLLALYNTSIASGNQTISNITLDGENIGYAAIYITRRSNVTIDKCIIKNFNTSGIYATDASDGDSPGISGIIIKNSQLINSSKYNNVGAGGIVWLRGTKDGEISNNIITASYRAGDSAGFCLKMSHLAKYKIYGNTMKVINHDDASKWIFAAELNHILGGIEVYNNTIEGIFDIAGNHCQKGIYAYSLSFHDNLFGTATLTSMYKYGITLENLPVSGGQDMSDVLIYNNTFRNLSRAIISMYYPQTIMQRIRIYNNLFYGVGWTQVSREGVVFDWMGPGSANLRDIYIDNNTMVATTYGGTLQLTAISLPERNNIVRNFRIRNNIIVGFDRSPIETGNMYATGEIDNLYIQNNLFYQNGHSNTPYWYGITPTNINISGQVTCDPLFISSTDFHLQNISRAIDAGIDIGLPNNNLSDIGAFEYSTGGIPPNVSNLAPIIQDQVFKLDANSAINTIAGRIVASDPDAGQTVVYSILSGNSGGAFSINASTGAITVANSSALNFTNNPLFSLVVKVQDNGTSPLSSQATIKVKLINVTTIAETGKPLTRNGKILVHSVPSKEMLIIRKVVNPPSSFHQYKQ